MKGNSTQTITRSNANSSSSVAQPIFDNSSDGILTSIRRGNIKHIEHAIAHREHIPDHYFNIHVAAECGELSILDLMIRKIPCKDINAVNGEVGY